MTSSHSKRQAEERRSFEDYEGEEGMKKTGTAGGILPILVDLIPMREFTATLRNV